MGNADMDVSHKKPVNKSDLDLERISLEEFRRDPKGIIQQTAAGRQIGICDADGTLIQVLGLNGVRFLDEPPDIDDLLGTLERGRDWLE